MRTEHQEQAHLLRCLLLKDISGERQVLIDRMELAERSEKCVRRASLLVFVLGLVALFGGVYVAILLPEFMAKRPSFLLTAFAVLGLGSLISLVAFAGIGFWLRGVSNEVHRDIRLVLMRALTVRQGVDAAAGLASPGTIEITKTMTVIEAGPVVSDNTGRN